MAMGPFDRDGDGPSLRRDEVKRDTDSLRATPFTDEVFAERDERPARSGGPSASLIVGVVLGVVLVGGVGWYAFKGPGGVSLAPGETQTVKADTAPYKMKPDNPGGMQVENQDKLVYDRVAKGAAPKRVENLLPPPEEPKAPPKAPEAKPEAPKPEPAKQAVVAPAPAPVEKAPAEKTMETIVKAANEPPAKAAAPATPAPATAAPAAPSSDAASLAAAVAAATNAKPAEAPKAPEPKAPEPKPEVQTAAVTPAAPTPPASTSSVAGAFQIQLVSVPTEEAAQSEWKRISGRHKDLFASLTPAVTKADLGDKGIYYRLRAGPLADKAAADQLCAALAADKVGCIVIKP